MRRLLVALVCLGFFAAARPAFGQVTYSIVKALPSAGGTSLFPDILLGADGNLYGTNDRGGANNQGFVFKLDMAAAFTILHDFTLAEGKPASVIQGSDGSLYGTTSGGSGGRGTVFRLTLVGAYTALHVFGPSDFGYLPRGGLVEASDGWFYGTLSGGGMFGDYGTVFKIGPAGGLVTLHHFSGADGRYPYGRLIQASDGMFYGTTWEGGASNKGTVFRMTSAGVVTTLHSFSGIDGEHPLAGVIQGSDGRLYGTTSHGGASALGVVYTVDLSGSAGVLWSFSGPDGKWPRAALLQASDGNLYGGTENNDVAACAPYGTGGTLFRVSTAGSGFTVLHTFGCPVSTDGTGPDTRFVEGPSGTLHGITRFGGNAGGGGTVFRLTFAVATTTTLNVSPTWATYGENVTLTATVTGGSPTGSVRFFDGATDIGLVPVVDGMAVLNPSLGVGAHAFTAAFEPTGGYVASVSDPVDLAVDPAPTATLLTVTPGTSVLFGEAVTLTANVVPGAGTPTGSVQFFDGATSLGAVPLSGGAAMLVMSTLAIGAHPITVVYLGDGSFAGSTSDPTTVTVNTIYTFGGFEQPLLPDGSASIQQNNAGRTIPVKFWLTLNGQRTGAAIANIAVYKVLDVALGTVDTTDLTEDSGAANDSGNQFRYDPVAQHYVFNLSTRGWSAPATYRIVVTLNDGGVYWVNFSLR